MQTSMGWGVTQTEMRPIYHQFARPYPGDGAGQGVGFLSTPRWPSHTDQFGVYYVRGPVEIVPHGRGHDNHRAGRLRC